MFVVEFAFYFSVLIYSLLYDKRILYIFGSILLGYVGIQQFIPDGKWNSIRRKIMFASWMPSSEPNVYFKHEVDCTNAIKYIETFPKEERPSITHIVIKMAGELLNAARTTLNGKIIFGKFVPFDTVDVCCLVDIGGGEDLAAVLVENCDKMKITEITSYLRNRANNIKKNKGDKEHKQRTGPIKFFPAFLVKMLVDFTSFLSYNLGLNVKPLAIKKNQFGGCTITSVGMLGFREVFAPPVPFMRPPFLLAVGEVAQKPIVKDGQIVIAPILSLMFTVDHRFIDGARAKVLIPKIEEVFANPEKF